MRFFITITITITITTTITIAIALVLASVGPMQSSWAFGMAQKKPRRILIRASMLAHEAHVLAREFGDAAPGADEAEQLRSIRAQLTLPPATAICPGEAVLRTWTGYLGRRRREPQANP